MIVLGIDPGTASTGYGVVESVGSRLRALEDGVISTSPGVALERRLADIHARVGALLILAAVVLSVIALVRWSDSSFKHLDYPATLRLAIPAAVALMLGVQVVLSSFFLSVLGIKHFPADDE